MEQDKKPSQMIRALLEEAHESPHRQECYLDVLDLALSELAGKIEPCVRVNCTNIFNELAGVMHRPEDRQDAINEMLIAGNLVLRRTFPIAVSGAHADFSAGDIVELPGYKKIHQEAAKADVAVNLSGLTGGEKLEPRLIIDIGKTYEEGKMESRYGYPEMAPPDAKRLPAPAPKPKRQFKM
ncbi:MAG: hypothetical protein KGQ70_00825 [Alphaproteobacteria bacterium]|nr:hypothetical protein [Alphaproteobacteria bacterium]